MQAHTLPPSGPPHCLTSPPPHLQQPGALVQGRRTLCSPLGQRRTGDGIQQRGQQAVVAAQQVQHGDAWSRGSTRGGFHGSSSGAPIGEAVGLMRVPALAMKKYMTSHDISMKSSHDPSMKSPSSMNHPPVSGEAASSYSSSRHCSNRAGLRAARLDSCAGGKRGWNRAGQKTVVSRQADNVAPLRQGSRACSTSLAASQAPNPPAHLHRSQQDAQHIVLGARVGQEHLAHACTRAKCGWLIGSVLTVDAKYVMRAQPPSTAHRKLLRASTSGSVIHSAALSRPTHQRQSQSRTAGAPGWVSAAPGWPAAAAARGLRAGRRPTRCPLRPLQVVWVSGKDVR